MRTDVCRFYNPSNFGNQCKHGIDTDRLMWDSPNKGPIWNRIPCYDKSGLQCDKKENYTQKEVGEDRKKVDDLCKSADSCKKEIRLYMFEKGADTKKDFQDWISCPVCGKGKLSFFYSGYNGHIHAQCDKEGCIGFQE